MSQTFFEDDDKTERERERETKKQNEQVASSTSSSSSSIFAHIHSVWEKHTTPTNASYLKKYFLFGYSTQLLSAIPHRLSPTLILSKSTSSKTVPPSETGGIGGGGIFFFPDGESRCFLFFCCWCCCWCCCSRAITAARSASFSKSISRETVSSAGGRGGGGGGISSSFSPGGGGGTGGRGWSLIFTLSIFPQHWSLHFLQNVSIFFFLSEYSSLALAL